MAEDEADKQNLQSTNNDEECSKMFLSDQHNSNFYSKAFTSINCSIPVNVLEFIHSFGYDCHRHFNLCACDENVVAWAAGSYIAFLDIITRKTKFQRSSTGGSIGSITKNPDPEVNHIAVGEGGLQWAKPVIIIYEWPSMTVVAVLRNGTEHSYAHMNYSPDGKMLASIGGAPDYNLTIWDWQKPCIILRTAAYSNTVFNVRFSPYIPGQLTTSGASHIKFWKMAPTFTCLKLKGELGRFGKTEICDIIGILPMPDEKVISGCSWGNILVWEGGLVKMEVCRKGRRSCHEGPVTQILRSSDTGEVTTIGFDGHICSWYWDTVEQADLPENDPFVELNPVAEIFIPNAKLMAVSNRKNDEWFAQDASGIIWAVSLENEYGAGAAEEIGGTHIERVVKSHGGPVVGLAPLRDAPFIATLGSDGTLLIHSSPRGPLLSASTSLHPATCMLYLPHSIDPTGRTLVLGFIDGSVRLLSIKIELVKHTKKLEDNEDCIILLQSLKPHTASVNIMSVNEKGNLLVTASLDSTIFIYQTSMESSYPNLNPMYYIKTPTVVNSLCWKPHYQQILLMAGNNCYVMEAELPIIHHIPAYEEVTSFQQEFVSLLTAQLKDYTLRYKPEEEEEGEDEQCFDEDSDSSEHLEETSESEHRDIELINAQGTKNKAMIWAKYDPKDVKFIWTAQEECGCLLRVCLRPEVSALDRFAPLDGAWDITVISHMFISNNDYCILGMSDGEVRIMKMPDSAEEISDNEFAKKMHQRQKLLRKKCKKKTLEPEMTPCLNFDDFLRLPMHDSITGAVTLMDISPCGNYFFTAGNDGNIFSYKNNLIFTHIEELSSTTFDEEELTKVQVKDELLPKDAIELSHEETAKEREKNSLLLEAAEHKKNVQNQLDKLRKEFNELLQENCTLPESQRVKMECDPRTLEELSAELDDRLQLVKRKLAHPLAMSDLRLRNIYRQNIEPLDVFPFQLNSILKQGFVVRIIRQKKLDEQFYKDLEELHRKIEESSLKTQKSMEAEDLSEETQPTISLENIRAPPILEGLPSSVPPPRALARALRDYLHRLERQHRQHFEWQEHLSKRVTDNNYEEEENGVSDALREAEATIGEYRLKCGEDSAAKPPVPHATYHTSLCIFITRLEIFEIQHEYNMSLMELREEKTLLVKKFNKLANELAVIAEELQNDLAQSAPFPAPTIDSQLEYPDKNLEVNLQTSGDAHSASSDSPKSPFDPLDEKALTLMDPLLAFWEIVKSDSHKKEFSTPWEEEYKERRTSSLLAKQDEIITEMRCSVEIWEVKLKRLGRSRERVMLRAQFLKLHLLRLTREQLILDAFQSKEIQLVNEVRDKQNEVKAVQDHVRMLQKSMELQRSTVSLLLEQTKKLEAQHRHLTEDSRFLAFLRRIYKKKQKPQRLNADGSSSGSSSDTESESTTTENDEDSGSDSEEDGLGRMRLDSATCPPGCDPQHYEQTVQLRDVRYDLENQIKEQEKLIEISRKDIENSNKAAKLLIIQLEDRQKKLKDAMHEKQSRLNEIPCVVVLSGNQCSAEALYQLSKQEGEDCQEGILVFPATTIHRLRERIQDLHAEAEHHKKRKSINKQHLHFLRVDCKNMERRVNELRECCSSVLSRKLPGVGAEIGTAAAATRALDTVLANMTRAFKMEAASGLTSDMQDQLGHWKKKECELEQKHCAALQEHTHKLRIAAALQAELLTYQGSDKSDEAIGLRSDAEYRQDLVRLRRLRKEQQRQIEDLRSEVHRLKLKPTISGRDMLPPLASSEVTSLPDTPPNTKLIAAALARSLREVGIGRHSNPRSDSALLDSIARIVPSLISGKINASEAMEEIIKSFSPRSSAQALRRPRQTIVDILGQITKQNVELGAGSATEAIGQDERAVSSSSLSSSTSALENALRALCSASKRANNTDDIDSAVAALLEQDPKVIRYRIDIDEVTRTLLESFENEYDESSIKELVTAVAECLAAQSTAPAEASEVAQECFQEIKDLDLKESNPISAESQPGQKSKRVSLVDDSDVSSVSSAVQIRATVSNKIRIDEKKNGDDIS